MGELRLFCVAVVVCAGSVGIDVSGLAVNATLEEIFRFLQARAGPEQLSRVLRELTVMSIERLEGAPPSAENAASLAKLDQKLAKLDDERKKG